MTSNTTRLQELAGKQVVQAKSFSESAVVSAKCHQRLTDSLIWCSILKTGVGHLCVASSCATASFARLKRVFEWWTINHLACVGMCIGFAAMLFHVETGRWTNGSCNGDLVTCDWARGPSSSLPSTFPRARHGIAWQHDYDGV